MTIIDLTTHKLTRNYGCFCEDALCLNTKGVRAIAGTKPVMREIEGIGLDVVCEGETTDCNRPMVRVKTRKGEFWADKQTGTLFNDEGRCMTSDTLRMMP